jgi:hypothetical protein
VVVIVPLFFVEGCAIHDKGRWHMEEDHKANSGSPKDPAPSGSRADDIANLATRMQEMTVNEKIKLALTGDTEARRLLIREGNRQIQMAVLNNPRITDSEIVAISNSRNVYEDLLRQLATSREWHKVYAVRLALVKNPKTPYALALRLVPTLVSNDLKVLAKSKSVPPAVATAAKRIVARNQ